MNDSLELSIEPAANWQLTAEQKERLTLALDGYLAKLERGLPPPREDLLASNPDLAQPLQAYFESLDQLHEMAGGFAAPQERTASEEDADEESHQGRLLGDFRLLREVGRGGMGVVYEAEQISLGRRVALKVLPFAAMLDGRQLARFKHEAQAAGQLNHPNIVSVYAVGVERGVHYYAMQFVDGQPLDRVIAEMRERRSPSRMDLRVRPLSTVDFPARSSGESDLPVRSNSLKRSGPTSTSETDSEVHPTNSARTPTQPSPLATHAAGSGEYIRGVVKLAIEAAEALHAAHENGIVHRDVKPSNLMLDGGGKLWVTDFGLARRQTDVALTRTGDLVGTMRYMSPEQAGGQPALVDHRTDIYSLGVTLYELLTLEPAIPGEQGHDLLRRIERYEPRPLRNLQPKVPADLETVIAKAMAKRREDRYATAKDFADDLTRVRDGKATIARPPTLVDRCLRWAVRHREIVAVAAGVCLLLLLGLTINTLMIAAEQRKTAHNFALAEKRFHEAWDAVERLGLQAADRLAKVPDAAEIRRDLLRQTLGYYRDFAQQEKDNPDLRGDLGITYSKIGELAKEIGSSEEAIDADRQAIGIFQALTETSPNDLDATWRLGVCHNNLGLVLGGEGKTDEARQAFREAIRLETSVFDKAGGDTPDGRQAQVDLALAQSNLGLLEIETGDAAAAATALDRAAELEESLLAAQPAEAERMRRLAATWNTQAALYEQQPLKAVALFRRAAAMQQKAAESLANNAAVRGEMANTFINLGAAQSRAGDVNEAAESETRAVEIESNLAEKFPAQKVHRQTLARALNGLGLAQTRLGQWPAAEASFRHAVALQQELMKHDADDVALKSDCGDICNNLGVVLDEMKHPADAIPLYAEAVAQQREAVKRAPDVARYRNFLGKHYYNYARALRRAGRPDEAMQAMLARRDLWPQDPDRLFASAEEMAMAAGEPAIKDRLAVAQKYGDQAVDTLKRAIAAGWKPKPDSGWARSFAAIKNRVDFQILTN